MTKQQLSQAVKIAESSEDISGEDIDHFNGFALPGFQPIVCTLRQVARLVRWQCQYIVGGGMDGEALNAIATFGRHRFNIV